MPNEPIVNAGLKYVNGLELVKTAAKVVNVLPGAARSSGNVNDIILQEAVDVNGDGLGYAVQINGAVVGANGCDQAVLAASSFYAVYLISDSTKKVNPAALLSLATNCCPAAKVPLLAKVFTTLLRNPLILLSFYLNC